MLLKGSGVSPDDLMALVPLADGTSALLDLLAERMPEGAGAPMATSVISGSSAMPR